MIEYIRHEDTLLAIIIRADYRKAGIEFFTPDEYSQQLAYMHHPQGYRIQPHIHNEVHRNVKLTQEVLLIRRGKVMVDFYDLNREHVCDVTLNTGDVILLASGGHGFRMLEATEMIEVKQGPYCGDNDKIRFDV